MKIYTKKKMRKLLLDIKKYCRESDHLKIYAATERLIFYVDIKDLILEA